MLYLSSLRFLYSNPLSIEFLDPDPPRRFLRVKVGENGWYVNSILQSHSYSHPQDSFTFDVIQMNRQYILIF
jgi:hypothetical protein